MAHCDCNIVHFADRTSALHYWVYALHYGLTWGQSREPGRFDTKSFRYKSKLIRYTSKVDSIQTHVTCFDTEYYYYTIYK